MNAPVMPLGIGSGNNTQNLHMGPLSRENMLATDIAVTIDVENACILWSLVGNYCCLEACTHWSRVHAAMHW